MAGEENQVVKIGGKQNTTFVQRGPFSKKEESFPRAYENEPVQVVNLDVDLYICGCRMPHQTRD